MTVFPSVLLACAAILGGLVCAFAIYFLQRRQLQAKRIMRELYRREDIYSRFIEQASEIWMDAFEARRDPGNIIGLSALVGRIRLASTQPVLEAAEGVMNFLLETSQCPPSDVREQTDQAPRECMAPLTVFTAACRVERAKMLKGL